MKIEIEIPDEAVEKIQDEVIEKIAESIVTQARFYDMEKNRWIMNLFGTKANIKHRLLMLEQDKEHLKNKMERRKNGSVLILDR